MRERIWTHPDHNDLAVLACEGFDGIWMGLSGERIDAHRYRSVERVATAAAVGYLKRFVGLQVKNEFKLRFLQTPKCNSQAIREQLIIQRLSARGFHPPELLAFGEETNSLGREHRSFLLTKAIDGTPFSQIEGLEEEVVLAAASHLGDAVAREVFLPDLGLDHIWRLDSGEFGLLDFHNARFGPPPSDRDLGRAVVRFFKSPGGADLVKRDLVEPFARAYLAAAERPGAFGTTWSLCTARLCM